jgi:nucleoside-diphosphate-sugar epimerase
MAFLVTGAAGFIGSHLVRILDSQKRQLIALDRDPLEDHIGVPMLDDLSVTSSSRIVHYLKRFTPIEGIFHLAATAGIGATPRALLGDNLIALQVMIDVASELCCPLVFSSSCAVYSAAGFGARSGWSLYGATKLVGEQMIEARLDRYRICRLSNVYGPMKRPKAVIGRWVAAAQKGDPLEVVQPGHQERDFVYVADVCRGLIAAMERPGKAIVDLCTGVHTPINMLARMFSERWKTATFSYVSGNPGIATPQGSPEAAQTELGWQPAIPLDAGLDSLVSS